MTDNLERDRAHCPRGFRVAGLACGIKPRGAADLALIHAKDGATSAAVFTRNLIQAAPIQLSRKNLQASGGHTHALVINSGCANAATGDEGMARAKETTHAVANALGCRAEEVLVNSTGVIGVHLASEKIIDALPRLIAQSEEGDLVHAARAIMTTDTRTKTVQMQVSTDAGTFLVAGIAKGSGMIHPDMATMIAVLLTDAELDPAELDASLRTAVEGSFHRITVDGDTSTNDSVFALASGKAGRCEPGALTHAFNAVARELAMSIVRDGEGARKFLHVVVEGAASQAAALAVARTVATSLLVRTAVTGGDPNWGRILAACGRSGVTFDPSAITLHAGSVLLFEEGRPADVPRRVQEEVFQASEVLIQINLHQGAATDEFFTCDLTEGYVHINADYTT